MRGILCFIFGAEAHNFVDIRAYYNNNLFIFYDIACFVHNLFVLLLLEYILLYDCDYISMIKRFLRHCKCDSEILWWANSWWLHITFILQCQTSFLRISFYLCMPGPAVYTVVFIKWKYRSSQQRKQQRKQQ